MATTPRTIRFSILLLCFIVAATNLRAEEPIDASSQIDAIIQRDLKKHNLKPNPPANEVQFVRRVYLDVIGRIPSDEELAKFYSDNRKDRRARLIDELLDSKGHPKPTYVHEVGEIVEGVRGEGSQAESDSDEPYTLAALVMPAKLSHVEAISLHKERMPAKSTYFFPKLLSGLTFNPLA